MTTVLDSIISEGLSAEAWPSTCLLFRPHRLGLASQWAEPLDSPGSPMQAALLLSSRCLRWGRFSEKGGLGGADVLPYSYCLDPDLKSTS